MLREVNKIISAQSSLRLSVFSFLLVAVVGATDQLTGYELSISIFYLIPVGFGSWYLRWHFGIVMCIVSAATWFVIDYTSGHQYSHPAIPFWNTGVRFGFFISSSQLLSSAYDALSISRRLWRN
jgi:hypothetical protein